MIQINSAGTCPVCGDTLYIFRTNQRKRLIKCDNDMCNEIYPIPKSGSIEYMGINCPDRFKGYPILMIVKKNSKPYFWVKEPCFNCSKGSSCKPLIELRDEYELD